MSHIDLPALASNSYSQLSSICYGVNINSHLKSKLIEVHLANGTILIHVGEINRVYDIVMDFLK